MRAIVCDGYGAPDEVLRAGEVADPVPAGDEVLVRVHAAAVNPADWHLVRGLPRIARLSVGLRRPGFAVPGSDLAGVVEAVGCDVGSLRVGDAVLGTTFMNGFGAFAERVAVRESLVTRKPEGLPFEAAAALPLAGSTALQALRDHGSVAAGRRVLVVGASGGVGTFAVQLATFAGAHVTGVCGARNTELVRSLGAEHVVDYATAEPWDVHGAYDLILQLAGTEPATRLRRLLTRDGTLVQLSGDSGRPWIGPLGRVVAGRMLSRVASQTITSFTVRPNRADLDHLARLAEHGQLTPVVAATYPLADVAAAIRHVEAGHTRGKVVVDVCGTGRQRGHGSTAASAQTG